jgi:hypothetical protein
MSARFFFLALRLAGVTAIASASALVGSGCLLSSQPTVERHPDGSYKLTCRTALPQCLEKAEQVCKGTRYVVTRAADHHDYLGGVDSVGETEVRKSEALFVCGTRGKSLWGKDADPMAAPSASGDAASGAGVAAAPPGAAAARACVPGATQQCTGPAACRGGQACLPDGTGFSACDCGEGNRPAASAAVVPPPVAPAPPSTPTPVSTPASPSAGGPPVAAPPGNSHPPR